MPKPSWWNRHWKWAVPSGCLMVILVCGGVFTLLVTFVFGLIKSSDVYTQSLSRVRVHPMVQAELGTPVEAKFLVSGNIELTGSSGNADISYGVVGPLGEGTVYAVAEKSAGKWTFRVLVVEVESSGERINLLVRESGDGS